MTSDTGRGSVALFAGAVAFGLVSLGVFVAGVLFNPMYLIFGLVLLITSVIGIVGGMFVPRRSPGGLV